jgi:CO/xanthine dehydrogenase FAD-binding subunit
MNLWQNYLIPSSLSEALGELDSAASPVVPIAGGTDLLVDLVEGKNPPPGTLLDLTRVRELTAVELRDEGLFVGAAVPLSRVARNELVVKHAPALVEACDLIGGPQVRNVATLGGNVAHALPAADGTIALLALDAKVEIASAAGRSYRPIGDMFVGPGKTTLAAGKELIVGFLIPQRRPMEASSFRRIMRPQGVALPIINLAVWLRREGEEILGARIAVGPGGPRPWRALEAEEAITGKTGQRTALEAALHAILDHVNFRTSPRRATSEYRNRLVESLFRQTALAAWNGVAGRGA